MAQKNIDFGTFPNDPDADAIRTAFIKTQENFTELFAGLQEQAVLSVNKTPGAGVTVFPVTGNVVVSANIACVTLTTHTLSLGLNGANGNVIAILDNSSTQQLTIDLPSNITGVNNASFAGTVTSNVFAANNSITSSNTITATGNITGGNLSTGGTLTVTGSANVGNLNAAYGAFSANVTASNIYSNSGTIGATTANISGNVNANNAIITGNVTIGSPGATTLPSVSGIIHANYFVGDGSKLNGVIAVTGPIIANDTSNVNIPAANGNVTISVNGTANVVVVTATGANITGNANVGNIGAAEGVFTANLTAANIYANSGTVGALTLKGEGGNISNIQGANVSGTVATATTAGTVTTAAQPNITSVGTLTSLTVTNKVTAGQLQGDGGNISNIQGANVSGTVSSATSATSATTAGTVTTAAQPNITSVGTLTSAAVTGNVTAGNVYANSGTIGAQTLKGEGGNISNIQGANVSGTVATATAATNASAVLQNTSTSTTVYPTFTTSSANGNSSIVINTGISANLGNASITATTFVGALSGAATTAGTVTTAAQPNITSVGTLSSVAVTGNATAGNVYANSGTIGALTLKGEGGNISNIQGANVSGAVSSATSATTAGTVTTAAQPNITSVGTLSSLAVTGNATAGNVYANSGTIGASLLTGTLTTAAQPNITSVGTLTNVAVTGNVTAGNVYANSGTIGAQTLKGEGGNISNIQGANVSGTVSTATTAGTVTTAAQPNITSVGTLSSLSITGNVSAGNANLGNLAVANFFQGDGSLLTNISISAGSFIQNGNSEVRVDANSDVRFTVAGTANVVVVTGTGANISGTLDVTGNITGGNVNAGNLLTANYVTGTLTTSAQPNITSTGTLTALNVNGVANLGAVGNVRISGGSNNQVLVATGSGSNVAFVTASGLTFAPGSNTQVLFNDAGSFQANANMTFDKTTGTLSSQALSVTANVTAGNVYANSGTVRGSLLTGTLTTAAQPNITSVGTLTSLIVSGNVNAGNVTVTSGTITANIFSGNATNLTNIPGSNVAGAVTSATNASALLQNTSTATTVYPTFTTSSANGNSSAVINTGISANLGNASITATTFVGALSGAATSATTAGTVTTAAQPNITSVGTLTGLTINGNTSAGRVTVNPGTATSNVHALTVLQTWNNSSVQFSAIEANITDTNSAANSLLLDLQIANVSKFAVSKEGNIFYSGVITGNGSGLSAIAGANVTGTVANATFATSAGSATTATSATSATSATTAGTVTTAAQPNITSVGTLSSLTITNKVTAGQLQGDGGNISNIQGANVSGAVASATAATNASALLQNTSTATTVYPTFTTSSANGNSSAVINTSISANLGNASITATTFVGALSGAATSATTAGTVTTAAQPNITSVGTLSALTVTANVTAGNVYANSGTVGALTIKGEGGNISNIQGANVSGAVSTATSAGSATTAGTVTTAAQPNITSTGTLTSLTVSGNIAAQANVNMTGYVIRSVNAAVSAAGTVQSNATAITKEINVVSTVASGAGVVLPTAVAGMVITITNTSANSLLVYPATNGIINSQSANAAYTHVAGATLQYVAPTTTQWYTVGATFA